MAFLSLSKYILTISNISNFLKFEDQIGFIQWFMNQVAPHLVIRKEHLLILFNGSKVFHFMDVPQIT